MPSVKEIELPAGAEMGVVVEGSASAWPGAQGDPVVPAFDVFNEPICGRVQQGAGAF
ncbi:MAG TPA: hypothetical protein VGZ73_32380 [Bryobacteraceae bacterium]|jgi:hypothetical protein|nr:hypothetical protein [Bryobacteraceae bacterium]